MQCYKLLAYCTHLLGLKARESHFLFLYKPRSRAAPFVCAMILRTSRSFNKYLIIPISHVFEYNEKEKVGKDN